MSVMAPQFRGTDLLRTRLPHLAPWRWEGLAVNRPGRAGGTPCVVTRRQCWGFTVPTDIQLMGSSFSNLAIHAPTSVCENIRTR